MGRFCRQTAANHRKIPLNFEKSHFGGKLAVYFLLWAPSYCLPQFSFILLYYAEANASPSSHTLEIFQIKFTTRRSTPVCVIYSTVQQRSAVENAIHINHKAANSSASGCFTLPGSLGLDSAAQSQSGL